MEGRRLSQAGPIGAFWAENASVIALVAEELFHGVMTLRPSIARQLQGSAGVGEGVDESTAKE